MGRWLEIPAHRIYEVTHMELRTGEYESCGESGRPLGEGEGTYLMVRKKDGKVFKPARFAPSDSMAKDCLYLEEV